MFEKDNKVDFLDKVIIKRTNRKKTISISIRGEFITVLSPKLTSKYFLHNILIKKKKWIERKLDEQRKRTEVINNKPVNEKSLQKFGEQKKLIFKKSSAEKIIENKNSIEVHCLSKFYMKKKLEDWLKLKLESYIKYKLENLKKLMKVDYRDFSIKTYKRKLGSCSYNKHLSFNLKIASMPKKVIDYIIIHELCHLVHFNHSKDFWKLVEKFCPEFKKYKKWIKKNENLIL